MTRSRYLPPVALAALAALVAVPVEYATTDQPLEALEALVAVALAGALACLVVSLPGVTARGLAFGGFFVGAGILSWSYSERPLVVWALLIVEGLLFAYWSAPWLRHLRPATGLGSAWLGEAYWLLGIVGAVLVLHPKVAAQRMLYAGVFGLAVLAVVASVANHRRTSPATDGDAGGGDGNDGDGDDGRARPDLSIGVAAAFLAAIAALLVSGAGNLFDTDHVVVAGAWGESMHLRFWGGEWLLYHPNSLAGIAVAACMRIGPDRRFAAWQRLAVTAVAGSVIYLTNSRTGFVFLATVGVVHAALLWWRRRRPVVDLPEYQGRGLLVAAATPFLVLLLVLVASGGQGFLFKNRYDSGGFTSGRTATWAQVGTDWLDAGPAEKLFGDAQTARAVVHRESSGTEVDLTTDNAAVGALRRGGALGVVAYLLGLFLLLRRAARRQTPAWFIVAAVGVLPTMATADWVLGGTGGTIWVLLLVGEAGLAALTGSGTTSPDGAVRTSTATP